MLDLARQTGARTITRPALRRSHATVADLESLAGLTAIRRLELATREHAIDTAAPPAKPATPGTTSAPRSA